MKTLWLQAIFDAVRKGRKKEPKWSRGHPSIFFK